MSDVVTIVQGDEGKSTLDLEGVVTPVELKVRNKIKKQAKGKRMKIRQSR